ncbi:MAG: phage integrase N-terminal SAM-like domain-containing protein [Oleiphilaceae bacterium]|nr:phage integrase N-terminal SAM-like domain-containing protein [Oleiphilaceae bacterium]
MEHTTDAWDENLPGLSRELHQAVQSHRLSQRTASVYQHWIRQYLTFYELENPKVLSEKNVSQFLRYLRKRLALSRARLNQAREALIFLYEKVLKRPIKHEELPAFN